MSDFRDLIEGNLTSGEYVRRLRTRVREQDGRPTSFAEPSATLEAAHWIVKYEALEAAAREVVTLAGSRWPDDPDLHIAVARLGEVLRVGDEVATAENVPGEESR